MAFEATSVNNFGLCRSPKSSNGNPIKVCLMEIITVKELNRFEV